MDLPTNYFITCDVNYVYNHKKVVKSVVVFEIALTVAAMGFNVLQSNSKGFALNKSLFLKLDSLYLLANDISKCHLCLSTGHMCADCPFKKAF